MKRTSAFAALVVVAFCATGCLGNLRADSAKRLSRKQLEGPNCKPKQIHTEIVRVFDERPSGIDYLAEVHAEGCGQSENFLCAQADSDWRCEPIQKK